MSQIALHQYHSHIEGLIDENRLAEAAAHCHFILQQHPRHVLTYRLFGRALLEQQYYREAIDVFQRVVSADPEDLIARAGLSIAYRQSGDLESAVWQMERAFELDPYNAAIRGELETLYGALGDATTLEIDLNRSALARLYARGGLLELAISEARSVLADSPERFDLLTLLAESLYWNGQTSDAVATGARIVKRLPDCIKANAIMAESWLKSGRPREAQIYLERLKMLVVPSLDQCEPETLLGLALTCQDSMDLPRTILVEELEYVAADAEEWEAAERWAKGDVASIPATGNEPIWLHEIGDVDGATDDEFQDLVDEIDEELDWLADLVPTENDLHLFGRAGEAEEDSGEAAPTDPSPFYDFPEEALAPEFEGQGEDAPEPLVELTLGLADIDVVEEEILRRAFSSGPKGKSLAEEAPGETADITRDLIAALDGLEEQAEEADWILDHHSDAGDVHDPSSSWLSDLATREEPEEDVPDWLYQAVGFTDELDTPEDYEKPGWIDHIGDTGQLSTIADEFQSETEPAIPSFPLSSDDIEREAGLTADDRNDVPGLLGELADGDASRPKWLDIDPQPGEESAEGQAGRPRTRETRGSRISPGDIPWLDDIEDDPGLALGPSSAAPAAPDEKPGAGDETDDNLTGEEQ